MEWIENAEKALAEAFKNRSFTAADAVIALKKSAKYRPGTSYRALFELERKGVLDKLGYGVYKMAATTASNPKLEAPEHVARLAGELRRKGIHGQITGFPVLSAFTNLIPRRIIYLIYVPRGAGEAAVEHFEAKSGKIALLNPSIEEIRVAFDLVENKDLAVIREKGSSYRKEPAVAPVEKAVVDLYYETTRKKIPFSADEAARIITEVITGTKIDFKKLLKEAGRRGIQNEFKAILYALRPELRLDNEPIKINEHAKSILRTTRGI
ncbi:MAG: DUF6577 family protein [Candidatus Micrarchaeota archaeon]